MNGKRMVLLVALAVTVLAIPVRVSFAAERGNPNVLLIYTDDQRRDTVSALGNPNIRTPNLDRLVDTGFTFDNAYCMGGFSGAVCLPSRMMLLRGRSWFAVRNLSEGFSNLPRSMNEAGYVTFFLGKRGNSDQAVQAQFDQPHYIQPTANYTGKGRGDQAVLLEGIPGYQLAQGAIAFLNDQRKRLDAGDDRPFFMYLAGPTPHDPRVAPQAYLDQYPLDKMRLPANYLPFHPFDNGEMLIRDEKLAPWPRTEAEIRHHLQDYYAVITHLDEQIGRILQKLRDIGEYDNTIIIYSADQGLSIGSHGLMGKQNVYEETLRVPLVFVGPGMPVKKRSDAFVYHFDIFPTICDLIGAPIPTDIEGKSLAPIIRSEQSSVRDTIFLGYKEVQRAVRRGDWKLIRYPKIDRTQLFNLRDDPDEMHDLSSEPANAGKVRELMTVMAQQQKLYHDDAPLRVDNPQPGEVDAAWFNR